MSSKIIKNIPNMITISRIISSIVASILFLKGFYLVSLLSYVYGAVSDFLDGHFAKKFNAYSDLGRKLDGFSDKIYALSLGAPAVICGNLLMLIPLFLEGKIGFYNKKREKLGHKVITNRVGKFKTAMLFPTLIMGLIATVEPVFYFLMLPCLYYSTNLQIKTYNSYKLEEKSNINNISNIGVEHEKMPLDKKIRILKHELEFYTNYYNPDNKVNLKIKKRVIK